ENAIRVADMAECHDEQGVSASWRECEGDILMEFAHCAIANDLSVVAAAGDDATSLEEDVVEGLLFRSGRPVLLCPEGGLSETPKRVVVAWNGSEEAARAVSASLSLLCDAETVKVITVRKTRTPMINTDEITAYLRLHGVEAAAAEIEVTGGESATERLDQEIRGANPDLVVMGAYSHSRWREAVLGGFTRHMIHRAKIPVLMMH
ncbi:MAG: universal stress protein, partial [Pseudomonadota bacterium]